MYHTFDKWMRIHYPHIPFERYADGNPLALLDPVVLVFW